MNVLKGTHTFRLPYYIDLKTATYTSGGGNIVEQPLLFNFGDTSGGVNDLGCSVINQ